MIPEVPSFKLWVGLLPDAVLHAAASSAHFSGVYHDVRLVCRSDKIRSFPVPPSALLPSSHQTN
jgi:hypothetical protein